MKYFLLRLKSKFKILPILCAVMLIFMGSFYILKNNFKAKKINLSLHFEEQSNKNNLILFLVKGTASVKNAINVKLETNLENAFSDLKNGKTDILINVPENFYESIIDGTNKSATIYFSDSTEIVKGVFKSLSESSVKMLSSAQANIYISDNIKDGKQGYRNEELNKKLLSESLNREKLFKKVYIKSNVSMAEIYISILISSIIIIALRNTNYINTYAYLKVRGNSIFKLNLYEVVSNTIILFLIFIVSYNIANKPLNMLTDSIKILIISAFISALLELLLILFKESCIFAILIISILSILNSGIIISRSIIPTYIIKAFSIMPISLILKDAPKSYILISAYTICFMLFTNYLIRRNFEWSF